MRNHLILADTKCFIVNVQKLPEDLQFMTYLKEWHIQETRIPEIPAYMEAFVDLRVLDVPRNGLTKIPVEIGQNPIQPVWNIPIITADIQSVSFITGKLINLRELNISYNKLSSIPPELGDCENLERLEMTANFNLEELPFEVKKKRNVWPHVNAFVSCDLKEILKVCIHFFRFILY